MRDSLKLLIKLPLKYQRKFTAVQKCILLGMCTLTVGVATGSWWPAGGFLGSLPLAFLVGQKILSGPTNLDIGSRILLVREIAIAKSQWIMRQWNGWESEISETQLKNGGEATLNRMPEVEVRQCLQYIYRDFVKSWYDYISDEEMFLEEAMQMLEQISVLMVYRVKQIDIHDNIPDYVLLIRNHILDYQEAMKHLQSQPNFRRKKDRTKEFKKVKNVVESFNRLGKYHIAVKNERELELAYLRMVTEAILKILLPKYAQQCAVAKELILEILTCQVLGQVLDMFSDPDFLHKVMVLVLSDDKLIEVDAINTNTNEDSKDSSINNSVIDLQLDNSLCSQESIPSEDHSNSAPNQHETISIILSSPAEITCLQNQVLITNSTHAPLEQQDQTPRHSNSPETTTESSVTPQDESTQLKVPIDTEVTNSLSQDMYVGDALSKHFHVSESSLKAVKVVESGPGPLRHNDVTSSASVTRDVEGVLASSTSQPSPPIHLNLTAEDPENTPEEITFTPSFFLASDDNISLTSSSSAFSGEHSLSPEGSIRSIRDSRSLSPERTNGQGMVSERHSREPAAGRTKRKLDVTDRTTVLPGIRSRSADRPRTGGLQRNNSADLLISPSARFLEEERQNGGMRRVASSDALLVHNHKGKKQAILTSSFSLNSCTVESPPPPPPPPPPSNRRNSQAFASGGLVNNMNSSARLTLDSYSSNELLHDGPVEAYSQDMPKDLFLNLRIYATEKVRDPSGSTYTIYLIRYRAWHLEADTWCLRGGSAHRRYREFVTLQERLEEHPIYKKKIRGIKGPQRWKVLPFGQIEIHGIEARRKFLEGYLQTLIARDQIANSLAIREFLAYEGDARIAFVKKATEVPRIDKMIAKTFSGVINKLTTRPPSHYTEDVRPRHTARGKKEAHTGQHQVDGQEPVDHDTLNLDFTYSHNDQELQVQTMENVLSHHIHALELAPPTHSSHTPETTDTPGASSDSSDTEGFQDVIEDDFPPPSPPIPQQPSARSTEIQKKDATPLISVLLDLAVELVNGRNSWLVRAKIITALKVTAGQALERLLRTEIDELITEDRWAHYIGLLSDTLWPDGELDTSDPPPRSEQQKAITKEQARSCLAAFLPSILPVVVGQEDFDFAIDQVMEVISHPTLNRHLVYTLMDAGLETLLPELSTTELQQQLLH